MSEPLFWVESLSSLWFPLSLVILYLGFILVLAEGLNRLTNTNGELTRKVVHIGAGHVILFAWWLNIPAWIGIGASAIACCIALLSYVVPILPSINSVGRKSLGTFFYAISIGILIGWFWTLNQPQYAAIGILVMAWGDGLAGIIGQNFGKHTYRVFGMTKSWEGSLTMTGASFLVTSLILLAVDGNIWQTWLTSLAVAVVATGLESFSKLGVDNFTVPIGSAALAFALSQFLS
ncbi:MAG: phosphatidate cytidylyltransferase [Hydrococcus sp. C42_A2020_068]|uniref:diacylglycerol/polyprenol kinase family protein n=1 Tax=Pleurocapsa sp. PCC 7327 TaxID=118163 RepID=UPI00029FDF49|nr:diacylglycerol/polyprenol kinase family protein [Pleurocapsa sp. PCC 7327]AFY77039.1 dolichol kinase [Pleurocapsa sp. PCC 7327]MBF2022411.1 phosphatidate cytidylyltransferase [Hydrococcus sp. C42_A2020_068]